MSRIGSALQQHFEQVCRSEMERLHRKTSGLSAGDRLEVESISLAVTAGIARQLSAALDRDPRSELDPVVAGLFAVLPQ
jgi:Glutamyl-tRNAGlu reductase, dimerisation domain